MPSLLSARGPRSRMRGIFQTDPHTPVARPSYPPPPPARPHPRAHAHLPALSNDWLADLSTEHRRALDRAQMAWLTRQTNADPRLARYSRQITVDELRFAIDVLCSLYDASAVYSLTLGSAIDWASVLLDAQDEAWLTRSDPVLPLPYLYLPRRKLDDLDAMYAEPRWPTNPNRAVRRRRP
jgi:hypothetical protein